MIFYAFCLQKYVKKDNYGRKPGSHKGVVHNVLFNSNNANIIVINILLFEREVCTEKYRTEVFIGRVYIFFKVSHPINKEIILNHCPSSAGGRRNDDSNDEYSTSRPSEGTLWDFLETKLPSKGIVIYCDSLHWNLSKY